MLSLYIHTIPYIHIHTLKVCVCYMKSSDAKASLSTSGVFLSNEHFFLAAVFLCKDWYF